MIVLAPLNTDDIDEKIRLNEDTGVDIYKLRDSIKQELKDFKWQEIRAKVQCQSYTEQLEHIENRIKKMEEKAVQSAQ